MPRESLVELYDSPGVARHATTSSPMFRAILDQAPTLLLLLDADGSVQYCNRRAQGLFGISAAELTDVPGVNFIVDEDRAEFREQLRLLVAGSDAPERRFELRFLDRAGTGVPADCTFVNLLAQPDVRAVLLSARELGEYKAMEQRLRDSERRFETVLWGGNIAYWDFDVAQKLARRSEQWFIMSLRGTLKGDARVDGETISGDLSFLFKQPVDAEFDIETFSGDISNCFGPKSQSKGEHGPGRELHFRQGQGAADVRVNSLSGTISICDR